MKTHSFKKIVIFSLAATLFWSCGDDKKKNTVSSSTTGVLNTSTQYVGPDRFAALLNKVPCRSGSQSGNFWTGNRLQSMPIFSSNQASGSSATTIRGPFNPMAIGGSTVAKEYVGISGFGDVMIVEKVTNGNNQVIGFNVMLSLCEMSGSPSYGYNNYNGQPAPYISDSRPLQNFSANNGIVLDDDTNCGHGHIDSASYTSIKASAITLESGTNLPVFDVITSFSNSAKMMNTQCLQY